MQNLFTFSVRVCRGDGAVGPGGIIPALDEEGGGAFESSNGSAGGPTAAAKQGSSAGGRGCSLAHASRCLHNVLYLCSARAQVRERARAGWTLLLSVAGL